MFPTINLKKPEMWDLEGSWGHLDDLKLYNTASSTSWLHRSNIYIDKFSLSPWRTPRRIGRLRGSTLLIKNHVVIVECHMFIFFCFARAGTNIRMATVPYIKQDDVVRYSVHVSTIHYLLNLASLFITCTLRKHQTLKRSCTLHWASFTAL